MSKVSRSVAILIKKKGFNEKCSEAYYGKARMKIRKLPVSVSHENVALAPSETQALRWMISVGIVESMTEYSPRDHTKSLTEFIELKLKEHEN
tara:strand:+ start:2157 stop:2435 length:279 start_codon:yes stop_codon:yes gene_type:complete